MFRWRCIYHKIAIATCLAFLSPGAPVSAEDGKNFPGSKKPASTHTALAPASLWEGWHIGAGIGIQGMMYNQVYTSLPSGAVTQDFNNIAGFSGLGYLETGYDYEIAPGLIIGVMADIDRANGGHHFTTSSGASNRYEEQYSWAAGVRLGALLNESQLWYAVGGYTRSRFILDVDQPGLVGTYKKDRSGLFAGLGVETKLSDRLSFKTEYRYSDYERALQISRATSLGTPTVQTQEFHIGLSYYPGSYATNNYPAPDALSWTGFYMGGGFGHGMFSAGEKRESAALVRISDGVGNDSFIGHVQAGYDYQISGRFLVGGFADYSFGESIKTQTLSPATLNNVLQVEQEPELTLGARFGWVINDKALLYGVAGYSRHILTGEYSSGGVVQGRDSSRVDGLVLGIGSEVRLNNKISLKFEYRMDQLNSTRILNVNEPGTDWTLLDPQVHSARLGVNYRF